MQETRSVTKQSGGIAKKRLTVLSSLKQICNFNLKTHSIYLRLQNQNNIINMLKLADMTSNNGYIKNSKISEAKFRETVKLFSFDLTAKQTFY